MCCAKERRLVDAEGNTCTESMYCIMENVKSFSGILSWFFFVVVKRPLSTYQTTLTDLFTYKPNESSQGC